MSEIIHSGVGHDENPPGRGSGRYGYGTGENPYQHQFNFLSEVTRLKKNGFTESQIAQTLIGPKANSTDLRAEITINTAATRKFNRERALKLLDETGGNKSEVARIMGVNESTVRSFLDDTIAERTNRYEGTAEMLKKRMKETGIVDVSRGSELHLGVSQYTKDVAVKMLEKEGYVKAWRKAEQFGTGYETNCTLLAPPGTTQQEITEIFKSGKNIQVKDFTPDEGKTWWTPQFPESISSKRVYVRYDEDGGSEKDGTIELRRGVEDISLGGPLYSQVRIAVDGTHYMKGLAIYSDEIPDGYDIVYNTNKKRGTPVLGEENHTVMKLMKRNKETGEIDVDNPFGATIKSPKDRDGQIQAGGQRKYIGADGKEHLSPVNRLQDEGDWDRWSKTLSSQFLAKQPEKLIKQQLDLSVQDKQAEFDKIMSLTNPVIKKKMLTEFADGCDSNAVDLSAIGFKDQAYNVLIPVPKLKDNECYAPRYKDGETLALIRYPHAGTFEIPLVKVNNKQKDAEKVMKNAKDAIGINSNVAERLSGADFDGDFVIGIPVTSNNIKISTSEPLKSLKGWKPKEIYKLPDSAPKMTDKTKQRQMGEVSNLITDMTIGGATIPEIERAVRHSMVVIDAQKHHLNWKQSEIDNNIRDLKIKYQGSTAQGRPKGASTILSRASSEERVLERKEINDRSLMTPEQRKAYDAGKKVYKYTGATKKKLIEDPADMTPDELKLHNAGKKVYRQTNEPVLEKSTKMYEADDAMDLVRDKTNEKEILYAKYANNLKSLANNARKEARQIKAQPVSVSAKKTYEKEVKDLMAKLRVAKSNTAKERQATLLSNHIVRERLANNPDLDFQHLKREKARALDKARAAVGAKKEKIVITDREWEAIQAGAISTNRLEQILENTDQEAFKRRATPRNNVGLTDAQVNLLKSMLATGRYTQSEIAERLGVSSSTVNKYV